MLRTTICFLRKEQFILLAMKKRGHGAGKWNGCGGKLHEGESLEQGVKREAGEELGITLQSIENVGSIEFIFPPDRNFDHVATVFLCEAWDGEPAESEEMRPQWFRIDDIPYGQMWEGDSYWLPQILRGKKIHARVESDNDDSIVSYRKYEVRKL
jgi:mutator protein MutT